MSNGKAVTKKSLVDEIIKLKRENVKSYGQQRQRVTSGAYIGTSGQKGGSDSNDLTTSYIKTAGDTMIGPLAFYPKTEFVTSGVLDVAESTGAYSSRIVVSGQSSSADNLVRIGGASHAGQILFLQAVNTTPITLKHYTDEGSAKGNIFIPGGSDYTVDSKEIVLLQWDTININPAHISSGTEYGQWTLISSSDGSTNLLTSNNVWTGTNQFTGSYVTVTGSFSALGTAITLGDTDTDIINFGGKMGTDINMNNYDIENTDRLLFSTTGTDNLAASDMGIGTNSADNDYLTYNIPSGYHRFKVNGNLAMSVGPTTNPGLTVENMLYVSGSITATGNVTFQQDITLGSSGSDDISVKGNIDTDISIAASKKIRAYTSTEIGYFVKNATSAVGSEGTIQIPTKNTGVGNAATADSDFGSEIGCIGLYTLGNPTLVIKYSSTGWQGIIFGSSGNPTQYQF